MKNCPFCSPNVLEDGTRTWDLGIFWIKANISPYKGNSGKHVMLIPKRHISTLSEFSNYEQVRWDGFIPMINKRCIEEWGQCCHLLRQGTSMQSQPHLHYHFFFDEGEWVTSGGERDEYIHPEINLDFKYRHYGIKHKD